MAVKDVTEVTSISEIKFPQPKTLHGKVAVVTGASRGIGAAIARELGAYGSHLVLNYVHSQAKAEALAQELEDEGSAGAIVTIQADVSKEDEAATLMNAVWEHFGRLDILVNNAGITRDRTFKKLSPAEWNAVINTNLNGVFYTTHAALPYLLESGAGTIVNIGSVIGMSGAIGQANYAAAKAGVIGFTKSLALELARYHITVNCVAPGYIETDMLAPVPEEYREQLKSRIPLGRIGQPEEVGQLVRYLVTEGGYMTGQTISLNGGLYI